MVEGKNNKQKNRTKYFLPGGKKQIQAVCAFLFLGVLILSCGVNLMHKDRQMSEKEMRMLAQKPEISLSGIASGRFMEQYEEYVSEQFAGRDFWLCKKNSPRKVFMFSGKFKNEDQEVHQIIDQLKSSVKKYEQL